jgi:translation initiation factor IF-2
MSKVRVYEIAKQLNMDQKSLVALFQSMGIGDVRNHMSAVETDVVERLKRHLERQKTPEVVEERIRPTVVKRRAKAVEPGSEAAPLSSVSVPQAAPSARASTAGAPASAPSTAGSAPAAAASSPSISEAEPRIVAPASSRNAVVEATPPARRSVAGAAVGSAPAIETKVEAPAPSRRSAKSSKEGKDASVRGGAGPESAARVTDLDFDAEVAHTKAAQAETAPEPVSERKSVRGSTAKAVREEEAPAPAVEAVPAVPVAPPKVEPPPPPVEPAPEPVRAAPPVVETVAEPRRPSSPPRTGIDVWQGRPGVPMPQTRSSAPPARRTTYDPRAAAAPARPGAPAVSGFPPGRGGPAGQRNRPGFRRPGMGGPLIKKPANVSTLEMSAHKKVIKIEEQVSLQQLAAKMSLKVTDVLMRLLSMGMTGVNINSTIDSDTAKILASEFGWTVEDVAVSEEATLEAAMGIAVTEDADAQEPRPPIVTVMGHVDHGKTSLLDRIRKATVAAGEAGGITQHIGAYRVETARGTIAFLDTPGHEAFTAMRARGAQATDIVILVVAADDGVMPQTREAINHAQSAKVPIVVAVNKIDKPAADIDKIKRDLANMGLQPEEWGGQTIFCPVSAMTGQGVDELLEAVLLQAEVLELRASPLRRANGVVIEALLDRGRGPVARIMVQDGTLKTGDIVIAGAAWGKVRAMTDEHGRSLATAGPSTPVEVLGLNEVPSAGDPVHAVKDAKTAEEIAETRRKKANKSLIPQDSRVSLEALKDRLAQEDQLELKLIIKGDVQGSVEAVGAALTKLSTQKVKVTVVHAAVGGITEGDVNLAIASKALIVGFNVRPAGKASALAESGGIEIRLYNIIYNAVDDIRSAMEGLLPTTKVEKELGKAEVRQVFRISKVGVVAGCYVTAGTVKRGCEARLVRDSVVVWTGKVASLRRIKDDVKEVAEGLECGISLDNYSDVKEGDVIEAFEVEEVKTKLT